MNTGLWQNRRWLAVVPALLSIGLFLLLPAALGLISTFTTYSPVHPVWDFAGLANYQKIVTNPTLGAAFVNCAVLALLSVPCEISLGLLVALALRRPFRGRSIVRAVLLLPWLISPIAAGVLWHFLYSSQVGIIGWLSNGQAVNPLADRGWALPAVAVSDIWRMAPLAAFLLTPGVIAVPQDDLDYARLAGVARPATVLRVVIPRIRPLFLTVVLLLIGASLSESDNVLIMTGGGPGQRTTTPALFSYNLFVEAHDWSQGTAASWVLVGVVLLVGVAYVLLLRAEVT